MLKNKTYSIVDMAVMSRTKRALGNSWNAINKQRERDNKSEITKEKPLSQEEHEVRIKKLRELGLIK
jgi:hypothetical protein